MSNYREYQRIIKLNSASSNSKTSVITPANRLCCSSPFKPDDESHMKEKKKITRTKTGCYCCRKRKKKCDEMKPACSGCVRNMLTCVYPSPDQIKKAPSRRYKKSNKKEDKFAAIALSELRDSSLACLPRSPTQPEMCSPLSGNSTPHNSDSESPMGSPVLRPYIYRVTPTYTLPLLSTNKTTNDRNVNIHFANEGPNTVISIKSLLN